MVVEVIEVAPVVAIDAGYMALCTAVVFLCGVLIGMIITLNVMEVTKKEIMKIITEALK